MIDGFCPASCFPKLLRARRTGMKTDKLRADICRAQKLIGFRHGFFRQLKPDGARCVLDPERFQERQMVIDRVQKADRRLHKFVVAASAQFRPQVRMVRGDSFPRARKKSQERRPIVAGEVEAVIEFAE